MYLTIKYADLLLILSDKYCTIWFYID